jgi:hypothetical protein
MIRAGGAAYRPGFPGPRILRASTIRVSNCRGVPPARRHLIARISRGSTTHKASAQAEKKKATGMASTNIAMTVKVIT